MLKTPDKPRENEPSANFRVGFIDGELELENEKLICNNEIVKRGRHVIEKAILERDVLDGLPEGHPWEKSKWEHADEATKEPDNIYDFLKEKLPDNYYTLLAFLASFHDLGRTIEGKKKLGLLPPDYRQFSHHGEESFNLLKEWEVLEQFPPETREIIEYAIIHHADKSTPLLPENPTDLDKKKYFYTCLLRDIDKLSLFRNKTDRYLFDPKEKTAQTKLNHLEGEQHLINPPIALETFGKFQTIQRGECLSYEAYMLQYLAWVFDIKLKTVLEEVVKIGAIEKILQYFREQNIPTDQYRKIEETVKTYLLKFNIKLEENKNL